VVDSAETDSVALKIVEDDLELTGDNCISWAPELDAIDDVGEAGRLFPLRGVAAVSVSLGETVGEDEAWREPGIESSSIGDRLRPTSDV